MLRLYPHYGDSIPRFHDLRRMRVRVPGYNVGKSGGCRVIYRAKEMNEATYIVFLETYSKSERADLANDDYETLVVEAEGILSQPLRHDWE